MKHGIEEVWVKIGSMYLYMYIAFHELPQIYPANYASFPIQMFAITV